MSTLKNYDPNERWGKHIVKVSFQEWDYKGFVICEMNGNCRGFDILNNYDGESLCSTEFRENPVNFKMLDDDWYQMILKNDDGDELIEEDEIDYLNQKIVGIEIIGFEKEEAK